MKKSKNSAKIDRRIKEYIIYELQTFYKTEEQFKKDAEKAARLEA